MKEGTLVEFARNNPPMYSSGSSAIHSALPPAWHALRYAAAAADYVLNCYLYEQIRKLFLDEYAGQDGRSPAGLTREYGQQEYLLVVDAAGSPASVDAAILDDFAQTARMYPDFLRWFRLDTNPGAGQPVLLVARWLCHLSGLRHITVEIFLDPPAMDDFTLVQVRGLGKVESPGAFDLPCAGHISGVDDVLVSLAKELEEELGLALNDLSELREINRFDAPLSSGGPEPQNHEFRVVFQARLKANSVGHIRFTDGEVAGLAVFSLPELRLLVERYPERVASGLREAIGMVQSPAH